jgi:hypothetical protein
MKKQKEAPTPGPFGTPPGLKPSQLEPRPLVRLTDQQVNDWFQALPFALNHLSHMEQVWGNGYYVVMVGPPSRTPMGPARHAAVRDYYGKPIPQHWSVLQRLKAEVFGASAWAIECYPPAAELKDEAHIYHLWVYEGTPFPFELNLKRNWTGTPIDAATPAPLPDVMLLSDADLSRLHQATETEGQRRNQAVLNLCEPGRHFADDEDLDGYPCHGCGRTVKDLETQQPRWNSR